MFLILIVVIGLVAWALHLMQQAVDHQEFSLMLAGFLVSSAAAGLVAVYLLASHSFTYIADMDQRYSLQQLMDQRYGDPVAARVFPERPSFLGELTLGEINLGQD
ncbi:MAG: hypothetical protein ACFB5Z_15610 [Elainellaceae cyanobacterium]